MVWISAGPLKHEINSQKGKNLSPIALLFPRAGIEEMGYVYVLVSAVSCILECHLTGVELMNTPTIQVTK
jgi:hypothetical protein